jgi:transcriptional regulator GlxA family with amidase domain
LPPLIHLGGADLAAHHPVPATVALLSAELTDRRPGSGALIERLTDVLFYYVVRLWIDRQGPEAGSWAAALRDDALARALTAMHHHVERPWEVADLAAVSGLSRSAFAEKFKRSTGETPGGYLARLRLQRAMVLLRRSETGLEAIAARVGYASAFALSKAFKRAAGVSPGAYRRAAQRPT